MTVVERLPALARDETAPDVVSGPVHDKMILDPALDLWRAAGGVGRVPVAGGSMRPTLVDGDSVRVRAGARPRRGDIVLARTAGGLVVHRVIGWSGADVRLRGDDTAVADPPVALDQILGRVVAIEGLAGRRLDGSGCRLLGLATAAYARTQLALGGRPRRPRPGRLAAGNVALTRRLAPPMAPEEAFVLLTARLVTDDLAAARARELAAVGLEWDRVVYLARLGQLGPLVYQGVARLGSDAAVPEATRGEVQRLYLGNLLRSREIADILGRMLARLADEGIPALALKGAALTATVYPDPALRIAGDIDLCVPDADRARAEAAVADIRAALVRANPDRVSQHGHHVELEGSVHHDCEPSRFGGGRWRATALDWAGIWQRAVPVTVGSHPLLVPCPTDMVLTLVANSIRRGFTPVRLVADIAATVTCHGEAIDWAAFEAATVASRLDRRSWIALALAVDWFGATVPARLLEPPADLRLAPWEHWLLDAKHRRPSLRLPTSVLWSGSTAAAAATAWRLWRAGRR